MRKSIGLFFALVVLFSSSSASAHDDFCGTMTPWWPLFYEGHGTFWTPSEELTYERVASNTVVTGAYTSDEGEWLINGYLTNLTSPVGAGWLIPISQTPRPHTLTGSSMLYKYFYPNFIYITDQCSKDY